MQINHCATQLYIYLYIQKELWQPSHSHHATVKNLAGTHDPVLLMNILS
jgi:hypothetical protein